MMCRGAFLSAAALALMAGAAHAGAWNLPKGEGQVILKYERETASRGFDHDGAAYDLWVDREDRILSLWGEYGLNERVTLLLKTDYQQSRDEYNDFSGWGLTELGARVSLLETERSVVSVQGIYGHDGNGRTASWAGPGEGKHEGELRLLAGTNLKTKRPVFIEGQLARRWRNGLPDETRLEGAVGVRIRPYWTMMWQVYAGRVDARNGDKGPEWVKVENGIIRHFDRWSVQGGWRSTLHGREFPDAQGPIVALWRRF